MATVDLINVSKQVDSNLILNQINLSIKKGEFMVLVGPSGCGKSTLLRLIAGLDELSSGIIQINNQNVNKIPAAKRDMAMVFQNYALYPHMTAFDNMAYTLKMRGFTKKERKARVLEVAQLLQLTPYLDRKPQDLSGGQKQRVAMGRAIVRAPAVFLFDEPLSNLDAQLRTEMRHEIKRLHQQLKTTSLYVTHDQTEAMTMADRVLVLNGGFVEQIGTPQELYQNPATLFVAGFMGHYPINFISASYDKKTGLLGSDLGLSYPLMQRGTGLEEDKSLILAIRPEHVQFATKPTEAGIELKIEFIDDMGADKLIQGKCIRTGENLWLRISADHLCSHEQIRVSLPAEKLHVFDQKTGQRLALALGE